MRRTTRIGLVCLAVTVAAQLWTLSLSPTVWQDEAQVIDVGRAWFEPEAPGAIWFEPDRQGWPQLSYLGSVLMESAYRLARGSFLGPRLVGLLSGVVAAMACLLWLRRLGLAAGVAWVAAFWLYLDPAIERSYRGARVDVLAIALALAACACVAGARPGGSARLRVVTAGAITAALPWIWLPAFLLWPLVGIAVWHARGLSRIEAPWASVCGWAVAGAVLATAVVAWPIREGLYDTLAAMSGLLAFDATAPNAAAPQATGVWASLWSSVRYAPWLPAAAVVGVLGGGRLTRALGGTAVLVALVVIGTRPYLYRYVYLVPYLVVLAAFALHQLQMAGRAGLARAARVGVVLTLIWSAGLAIGYRTYVAVDERAGRDSDRLRAALGQAVGEGPHAVYVEALEVYHAGRALGWRMYRATYPERADHWDEALHRSDAVVIHAVFDSPARRARFALAGFDAGRRVELRLGHAPRPVRYGGAPYGPFVVFRRVR